MNWAAFLLVIAAAVCIGAMAIGVTWVASVLVRNWGVYAGGGLHLRPFRTAASHMRWRGDASPMNRFSLNTWGPYPGEFALLRIDFDWMRGEYGYFSANFSLFGFTALVTYWPHGKPDTTPCDPMADDESVRLWSEYLESRPAYLRDFGANNVPVEDLGGKPVGMEKAP